MDRKFYSQHGEDFILSEIFKNHKIGFFVEIGCIDGRRFSNTLTFEEMGWKGLCVEAHSDYIRLLKKNRPNSIVSHCAVGECDENNVTFYTNPRGSLSTLDKSKEAEFSKRPAKYFSGFGEQNVDKRRLDTLLKEFNIKDIDILSVDVEGYEVKVLEGIDFSVYKPRALMIESEGRDHERKLDNLLIKEGYYKSVRIQNNILYLIDKKMENNLKNGGYHVTIIHTQHPLDNNGDTIKRLFITIKNPGTDRVSCEIRQHNDGD